MFLQQSRKRKAQKPAPVAAEEDDGSDEEAIEKSVLYAHKPSKRTSFLDQKLVEMGTDRIMRKQAKISKRAFEPEKRTTNQVMNQIRRVRFVFATYFYACVCVSVCLSTTVSLRPSVPLFV